MTQTSWTRPFLSCPNLGQDTREGVQGTGGSSKPGDRKQKHDPCHAPKGVSGQWHMVGAWCQETDVVLKATYRIPTSYLDTFARLCQLLGKVRDSDGGRSDRGSIRGRQGSSPSFTFWPNPSTFTSLLSSPGTPPQVGGQEQVTLTTARRCWYLLHPAPSPPTKGKGPRGPSVDV